MRPVKKTSQWWTWSDDWSNFDHHRLHTIYVRISTLWMSIVFVQLSNTKQKPKNRVRFIHIRLHSSNGNAVFLFGFDLVRVFRSIRFKVSENGVNEKQNKRVHAYTPICICISSNCKSLSCFAIKCLMFIVGKLFTYADVMFIFSKP